MNYMETKITQSEANFMKWRQEGVDFTLFGSDQARQRPLLFSDVYYCKSCQWQGKQSGVDLIDSHEAHLLGWWSDDPTNVGLYPKCQYCGGPAWAASYENAVMMGWYWTGSVIHETRVMAPEIWNMWAQ